MIAPTHASSDDENHAAAADVLSTLAESYEYARDLDAPLSERLAFYAARLAAIEPTYAAAYQRLVDRLTAGDAGTGAPRPGEAMPPFLLPDRAGRLVSLQDLTGKGPAVISFNRGHWCRFCRLELTALTRIEREARRLGAEVIAILPERSQFAGQLETQDQVPFRLLCDIDNAYATSLGLLMAVGEELEAMHSADGLDLTELNGMTGWFLPLPATFVVGRDGLIAGGFVDPDFRKRMELADIIAALGKVGGA